MLVRQTPFSTRQLDILCFETESNVLYEKDPKSPAYQAEIGRLMERYLQHQANYNYQIIALLDLLNRYENGYDDQIADKHEAEKRRRVFIALSTARYQSSVSQVPDRALERQKEFSEAYIEKNKSFFSTYLRTAKYRKLWSYFHLFRFFILGLFLAIISFAALPVVSTYLPWLGKFFVTYDYAAHMIFGIAGSLYCFEGVAELLIILKHFLNAPSWQTLENAFFKGNRPGVIQNAVVWTFANGLGFYLTGSWADSTSFSAGWEMPTWGIVIDHWVAAGLTIVGLIHDIWNTGRQTTQKVLDRTTLAETRSGYSPEDLALIQSKAPQLSAESEETRKIQKEGDFIVATLKQFLGSAFLFYAFAKAPWAAWTVSASASYPLVAAILPWVAASLGVVGGVAFTHAAWCFLKQVILPPSSKPEVPPVEQSEVSPVARRRSHEMDEFYSQSPVRTAAHDAASPAAYEGEGLPSSLEYRTGACAMPSGKTSDSSHDHSHSNGNGHTVYAHHLSARP